MSLTIHAQLAISREAVIQFAKRRSWVTGLITTGFTKSRYAPAKDFLQATHLDRINDGSFDNLYFASQMNSGLLLLCDSDSLVAMQTIAQMATPDAGKQLLTAYQAATGVQKKKEGFLSGLLNECFKPSDELILCEGLGKALAAGYQAEIESVANVLSLNVYVPDNVENLDITLI